MGGLIEATAGLTVGPGPVPAVLSPASGPADHLVPAPVTMNNGKKDTNNADVQKLQEQLNDIKEQVKVLHKSMYLEESIFDLE